MSTKRIAIAELQVGMFVTGTDRSWFRTPFLRRKYSIDSTMDIERLKRSGVTAVDIDTSRGRDVSADEETPELLDMATDSTLSGPAPSLIALPKSLEGMAKTLKEATAARQKLERTVHCLFDNISATGAVDPQEAHEAAQEIAIVTRTLTNPALFAAMSRARDTSPQLGQHAMSVCTFSMILGQALGLNLLALQELAIGALLHDVGLVRVPSALLARVHNSSRPLAAKERKLYEEHGKRGAVDIERQGGFALDVRRIVAEHHVYLNRTGYPDDLHPEWICQASRIVMVADQYDELISGFGGRTPVPPHEALQQLYRLAKEGTLDVKLVQLFIKRVGVFPVYSAVQLNTGERGVIADLNPEHLHLPVIYVTHAANGESLPMPVRVDLMQQDPSGPVRSIAHVLKAADELPAFGADA
ncbi:MAG: DUF3391 domain-containing protein [Nitrospiraceae bacterium]